MMPLGTVADYVAEARTLLQDKQTVKRYSDAQLVSALGLGVMEGRRLRPDLFIGRMNNNTLPEIVAATPLNTAVDLDPQYRMAFLYYMVGHVLLADTEETDGRKGGEFKNKFIQQMLILAS